MPPNRNVARAPTDPVRGIDYLLDLVRRGKREEAMLATFRIEWRACMTPVGPTIEAVQLAQLLVDAAYDALHEGNPDQATHSLELAREAVAERGL